MFTGIIEAIGEVMKKEGGTLTVSRPSAFSDCALGSSVCVSGVCLSIVSLDHTSMTFDVIASTLQKSTLGTRRVGDRVNLERAMPANGRLEGHIVQGHVEERGTVERVTTDENKVIRISYSKNLDTFVVQHGSITVDGVALTVSAVGELWCEVSIIPHTLKNTTLGRIRVGDSVNLESDIIGRFVANMMRK